MPPSPNMQGREQFSQRGATGGAENKKINDKNFNFLPLPTDKHRRVYHRQSGRNVKTFHKIDSNNRKPSFST
jgi:hypothetical protein